jgi:hypothetical protein
LRSWSKNISDAWSEDKVGVVEVMAVVGAMKVVEEMELVVEVKVILEIRTCVNKTFAFSK